MEMPPFSVVSTDSITNYTGNSNAFSFFIWIPAVLLRSVFQCFQAEFPGKFKQGIVQNLFQGFSGGECNTDIKKSHSRLQCQCDFGHKASSCGKNFITSYANY